MMMMMKMCTASDKSFEKSFRGFDVGLVHVLVSGPETKTVSKQRSVFIVNYRTVTFISSM